MPLLHNLRIIIIIIIIIVFLVDIDVFIVLSFHHLKIINTGTPYPRVYSREPQHS